MIDTKDAINKFSELSSSAQAVLNKAMSSIDNGIAPDDALTLEVSNSLKCLRSAYDSIKTAAKDLPECPGDGDASVSIYTDALTAAEARKAQEATNVIVELLEKFIRVTSDNKTFAEALSNSQKEAAKTLELIKNGPKGTSALDICDNEKDIHPREVFFKAMEREDLSDDEGLALIDVIEQFYPTRVQQGLIFKKYYVADAKLEEEARRQATPAVPASAAQKQTDSPRRDNQPASLTATRAISPAPLPGGRKKIGVKAFMGDISGNGPLPPLAFTLLALWPGLSAEQIPRAAAQIYPLNDYTDEGLLAVVEKLMRHGYVGTFESPDGITRYALTKEARKLCTKPSVYGAKDRMGRSFWPQDLPSENESPSVEEKFNAYLATAPEEVTKKYDLMIGSLEQYDAHAPYCLRPDIDQAFTCSIDSPHAIVSGERIDCEVYVSCQAELPSGAAVLSDTAMPSEALNRGYEHWFIFKGGEIVDMLADDTDGTEEGIDQKNALEDNDSAPIPPEAVNNCQSNVEDSGHESIASSNDLCVEGEPEAPNVEPSDGDNAEESGGDALATDTDSAPTNCSKLDSRAFAAILSERRAVPSDEEVQQLIAKIFDEADPNKSGEVLAFCLAFLKSVSIDGKHPYAQIGLRQLALACDSKIEPHDYTGGELGAAFKRIDEGTNVLLLAACCQAMLSPKNPYDYELNNFCKSYMDSFDEVFSDLAVAKPLFNELQKVWEISPDKGMSRSVVAALGGEKDRSCKLGELQAKAQTLCKVPTFKAAITGMGEFSELCFGKGSDLGRCMEAIADNKNSDSGYVREVFSAYRSGGSSEAAKIINVSIDDNFQAARASNNKPGNMKLISTARKKAKDSYEDRLCVMEDWLGLIETPVDDTVLAKLANLRDDLLKIIDEASSSGHTLKSKFDHYVLTALFESLKRKLTGNDVSVDYYGVFLTTGYVSVVDGLPVLNPQLDAIAYCEPWRNVLMHHASDAVEPHAAAVEILREGSDNLDNIGQLKGLVTTYGPFEGVGMPTKEDIRRAGASAVEELKKLEDDLEMAYAYNKIDEIQKERLSEAARISMEHFFDLEDFGSWRRFLNGIRREVADCAAAQKGSLGDRLLSCERKLSGKPSGLIAAAKKLFENENYAVVEEYLNRFEAGEREIDPVYEYQKDDFSEFISSDVYGVLYSHCKAASGKPLSRVTADYIKTHKLDGRSQANSESAKSLVSHWPAKNAKTENMASDIVAFLKGIGIEARKAESVTNRRFRVSVRPLDRNRPQYEHPIAVFGTRMPETIDVLVHFGQPTHSEIVQAVSKQNMTSMSIVIVDEPMRLEDKRVLAERFHAEQLTMQFIAIDRVLALYLALHERAERLALALKCSLPFTYYQPFVRDGGPTPDEMFCGRTSELRSVVDPGGACVVYGGRQLGKTALLQRAESLAHQPDANNIAVYVSILNYRTEKEVTEAIVTSLRNKADLDLKDVSSLRQLCDKISELMRDGTVSRMLLLIDECDNFLNAISDSAYKELQPLVDLRRETQNGFKFVIAGLHNVCRAKNATENNGIFGQLGSPICIKPFSPREALQLISRPLMFLGFQVDRYPHLETILTNTNYYPGIIQFFGHILVETMKRQYGDYYRAADGNPPYQLNEKQLGAILNEADLNKSIREKFRLSLELDNRYFMLARCIALLCYSSERNADQTPLLTGFSAATIKSSAEELGIERIASEDMKSLLQLLDEMVDMGILSKPNPDVRNYKLRRRTFLNAIGTSEDAILNDIIMDGEGD